MNEAPRRIRTRLEKPTEIVADEEYVKDFANQVYEGKVDAFEFYSRLPHQVNIEEERPSMYARLYGAIYNVARANPELSQALGEMANTIAQNPQANWAAVGRFVFDEAESDFEVYLEDPSQAARLMAGDEPTIAAIRERLLTGAREKHAREEEARLRQEKWAAEQAVRDARFRELCEKFADLEITLEDSLAAGNCRPGTEAFRDREFPGRNSVTVKALTRFLSVYGVRRVLEHKLLPLVEKEKPNS